MFGTNEADSPGGRCGNLTTGPKDLWLLLGHLFPWLSDFPIAIKDGLDNSNKNTDVEWQPCGLLVLIEISKFLIPLYTEKETTAQSSEEI